MTTASGIGSWPGTDVRETLRVVRDALGGDDGAAGEGEAGWLPYLPELPDRGPGSDVIGRAAGLLVELPVDLQPIGWRFVDRPGLDAHRTAALLSEDLDELAEAFDGWTGRLKLQVAGPWTLAASVWLHRGERAVVDEGASRDLVDSLAEGVRQHLAQVRRLVPGAELVLQLDEPSLPAVLAGHLPTASGFGTIRAVDRQVVLAGLRAVLAGADGGETLIHCCAPGFGTIRAVDRQVVLAGLRAVLAGADGGETLIHCCAPGIPLPLLRQTAADLATDTALLDGRGWEEVAGGIEDGMTLYAGCVPTAGPVPRAQSVAAGLVSRFREIGLPPTTLGGLVVTPACGLASVSPQVAREIQRTCVDAAKELTERALD